MAKKPKTKASSFSETIELISNTVRGQEAAMYGPLRDLFCDALGYARGRVLIDVAGDAGRPDITCRAPNGLTDKAGRNIEIDWIVVEAKDERNAFLTEAKREAIFAQKSKYITPNTSWFVMVDPCVFVARPVFSADLSAINDIVFRLDGSEDEHTFRTKFSRLAAEVAGVPEPLWNNIRNFVRNIGKLPLWVSHDMSATVFGGKSNPSMWQAIFEKGTSPQGQRILSEPLNLIKLIQN